MLRALLAIDWAWKPVYKALKTVMAPTKAITLPEQAAIFKLHSEVFGSTGSAAEIGTGATALSCC